MNISAQHPSSIVADTRHPLDPLTYEELAQTAAILRDVFAWGEDLRVETIDIEEPLDSGAKRNGVKRSGFECPFQARQSRLGMAS
jgi:Cu2+-containing amine oxidase